MEKKPLPPQVRRHINRAAHRLALAAEADIHARLTAQAWGAVQSGFASDALLAAMTMTEADLAAMAMTDGDWKAATMSDAELLGWLASHAVELPD